MNSSDLVNRLAVDIDRGRELGWHQGAQLSVSMEGLELASMSAGEDGEGHSLSQHEPMPWLCNSKLLVAFAVARLWQRDELDLDAPVDHYLGTAASGPLLKFSLRQLMTYTAGPDTDYFMLLQHEPYEECVELALRAEQIRGWRSEGMARYDLVATAILVAAVCSKVASVDFRELVRSEVTEPLGLKSVTLATTDPGAGLFSRDGGAWVPVGVGGVHPSTDTWRPGGTARGNSRDLLTVSEVLWGSRPEYLSASALAELTSDQRPRTFDESFRQDLSWGLGVMVDPELLFFGGPRYASRVSGHHGFLSSLAFSDMDHQISIAAIYNGVAGPVQAIQRVRRLIKTVYNYLEIAEMPVERPASKSRDKRNTPSYKNQPPFCSPEPPEILSVGWERRLHQYLRSLSVYPLSVLSRLPLNITILDINEDVHQARWRMDALLHMTRGHSPMFGAEVEIELAHLKDVLFDALPYALIEACKEGHARLRGDAGVLLGALLAHGERPAAIGGAALLEQAWAEALG